MIARWRWIIIAVAVLVVVAVAAFVITHGFELSGTANATVCLGDDSIPRSDREAIEARASRFVDALLDRQVDDASAMMSPNSRPGLEAADAKVAANGPYADLAVTRTYLAKFVGLGSPAGDTVSCESQDPRNKTETVPIGPTFPAAFVVITAKGRSGNWKFQTAMHLDRSTWVIDSETVEPSSSPTLAGGWVAGLGKSAGASS